MSNLPENQTDWDDEDDFPYDSAEIIYSYLVILILLFYQKLVVFGAVEGVLATCDRGVSETLVLLRVKLFKYSKSP